MLSHQFLQPCDANPDYANSAITRSFSISESTLRGILKRRIRRSDRLKKKQFASKICTHEKNQASASGSRYSKPKIPEIAVFEIVLLYITFLRMLKKIDELTGAVDVYLLTSQNIFSSTKLLFHFDLVRNSEKLTFTEKLVKNFYPDLLPAHPKFYSEDRHSMGLHVILGFRLLGNVYWYHG